MDLLKIGLIKKKKIYKIGLNKNLNMKKKYLILYRNKWTIWQMVLENKDNI